MKNSSADYSVIVSLPIGLVQILCKDHKLLKLTLLSEGIATTPLPANNYYAHVIKELHCYFDNPKHRFTIHSHLVGTPFQQRVWQALQSIPPGQTRTYGELAKQLKTAPRAVGQACRTNPIAIMIPCHRIVAAQGFGGFAGEKQGTFMDMKKWLLQHEQEAFSTENYPS